MNICEFWKMQTINKKQTKKINTQQIREPNNKKMGDSCLKIKSLIHEIIQQCQKIKKNVFSKVVSK